MTNLYSGMPRRCLLCAKELTPHECSRANLHFCGLCGKDASAAGRGRAHLCLNSPEKEWGGGIFMASEFRECLKSTVYNAVYDSQGKLLKLYASTEMREYETWAETAPSHILVLEDAFRWPVGMVVEIWDQYIYDGTFEVVRGSVHRRFLHEIEGAEAVGSQAFTHTEFSEREPNLRYRRLLDPNWQFSLTERAKRWRRAMGVGNKYYAIGMAAKQTMLVSDEVYAHWRRPE